MQTGLKPAAVLQAVHDQLAVRGALMDGSVAADRFELYVPSDRQHLWSPQLSVIVLPTEGGRADGARLRGWFGPHPHVWALYVAMGAATAFGTLVALSFAYAQWVMGQAPSALWALPSSLLAWAALYSIALLARRWGAEQVEELRTFLESGLAATERRGPSSSAKGVFLRRHSSQ
jgi:hypothetical protein